MRRTEDAVPDTRGEKIEQAFSDSICALPGALRRRSPALPARRGDHRLPRGAWLCRHDADADRAQGRRFPGPGGALLWRQGRRAGSGISKPGASRQRGSPHPPRIERSAARANPGAHRRQSGTRTLQSAYRQGLARILGPGAAGRHFPAHPDRLSAPHAVQSAQRPQTTHAGAGSARSRGDDRRDDRWRLAARGSVRLARSGQRYRARDGDCIRR